MKSAIENVSGELFTTFNDLVYYDEPHKYYINKSELISVTTLLHQYTEEFDEEYWSDIKAKEFGIPQHEIKRAWNFINKKGTMKGSAIHDYSENLFLNKIFKYPKELIINAFGFDPIWVEYEITKRHVDKFYKDCFGKLIPVKTELVVYDKESQISGMMDMLFYNIRMKEYQIYDWKTNKEFSRTSTRKLLGILGLLSDTDLDMYSLQLEFYKQIIERNTSIRLGQSYLVWFSHNNPSYEVIKTKNMSYYVSEIINERIKTLAA